MFSRPAAAHGAILVVSRAHGVHAHQTPSVGRCDRAVPLVGAVRRHTKHVLPQPDSQTASLSVSDGPSVRCADEALYQVACTDHEFNLRYAVYDVCQTSQEEPPRFTARLLTLSCPDSCVRKSAGSYLVGQCLGIAVASKARRRAMAAVPR